MASARSSYSGTQREGENVFPDKKFLLLKTFMLAEKVSK
jgi:hypothetical protein